MAASFQLVRCPGLPWRQVFNLSVAQVRIPQVKNSWPRVELLWSRSSCRHGLALQDRQTAKAGETAPTCLGRESAVFWQATIPSRRRLYAPCLWCRCHLLESRRHSDAPAIGIDERRHHAFRSDSKHCSDTVSQAAGHHRLRSSVHRRRGSGGGGQSGARCQTGTVEAACGERGDLRGATVAAPRSTRDGLGRGLA